ncbi:C-type lectin domain family 4 member G-like protein [Leptotrombidium deliense]|uniref:C-type lectin domain family 4 member G-like protein n=1 Tax=Leptotrombidium deliense TaxID=299467 RepID=A0A443S1G4_9ACAR|nr:C-type lectin domain family 4 member G-like protein [Leptotrombidium deliense]
MKCLKAFIVICIAFLKICLWSEENNTNEESKSDDECPEHWIRWTDKCYKTDDQCTTFIERLKICSSLNASMLMISSEYENEFIEQHFRCRYWLGAIRYPGSQKFVNIKKVEIIQFTLWHYGEPNNFNATENCIEIKEGKWNDLNCHSKMNDKFTH